MIEKYFADRKQAVEELGICRMTLYRWLKAGRLTAEKINRTILIPRWQIDLERSKRNENISRSLCPLRACERKS